MPGLSSARNRKVSDSVYARVMKTPLAYTRSSPSVINCSRYHDWTTVLRARPAVMPAIRHGDAKRSEPNNPKQVAMPRNRWLYSAVHTQHKRDAAKTSSQSGIVVYEAARDTTRNTTSPRVSLFSMVRQAMVSNMLGLTYVQDQNSTSVGFGPRRGEEAEFPLRDGKGERRSTLAIHGRVENPSKCIMWCTIALEAHVQGRSVNFVRRLCCWIFKGTASDFAYTRYWCTVL